MSTTPVTRRRTAHQPADILHHQRELTCLRLKRRMLKMLKEKVKQYMLNQD